MRCVPVILFAILLSFHPLFGQSTGPYCISNAGASYNLAQIDLSTGFITNIGLVPGIDFFVLGNKYCISTHDSTYVFSGHDGADARLYTLSLSDASILHNPVFNDIIVGLRYNCLDSNIYAIREDTSGYQFVSIEKTTGAYSVMGNMPSVTGYVAGSFSLDPEGAKYHFMAWISSGIRYVTVDIATGSHVVSPPVDDNFTGLAFSCNDSVNYAVWEDSIWYMWERVDPASGGHATVDTLALHIAPGIVAETHTVSDSGLYTYRGFDTTGQQLIITIQTATGNVLYSPMISGTTSGHAMFGCCTASIPPLGQQVMEWEEDVIIDAIRHRIIFQKDIAAKVKEVRIRNLNGQLIHVFQENEWADKAVDIPVHIRGLIFVECLDSNGGWLVKRAIISDD